MINNSFIFLEKISKKKEQNIWNQKITNWNQFIEKDKIKGISNERKLYYNRKLQQAQKNIQEAIKNLPSTEMWRIYPLFKDECCFLDIEINSKGQIIVVGISDYYHTNFFVRNVNLHQIQQELNKYKLVVTFNGSSFDIPKLKKQLHIKPPPHLDLKPLCLSLNLKGGLKEVEKQLKIPRPKHLYGNPIQLWKAFHASGDKEYLQLLLNYNREDCENLKLVADYAVKKYINRFIFINNNGNGNALGS